jgi:hypothetical protein
MVDLKIYSVMILLTHYLESVVMSVSEMKPLLKKRHNNKCYIHTTIQHGVHRGLS